MRNSKKLTLSALFSALGIILLSIGSIFEPIDLSMAALAGFVVVLAVIEIGGMYPYLIYFVISALSLLLLPNRFPGIAFLCFAGNYPIFKSHFERFHPLVTWSVKFSYFNVIFAVMIYLVRNVFMIPDTVWEFRLILFAAANLAFLLYDIAMTRIITLYLVKLRRRFGLRDFF